MPSLPTSGVLRLDGYLGVELARAALGIRHLARHTPAEHLQLRRAGGSVECA
jgi:hypothetical protein